MARVLKTRIAGFNNYDGAPNELMGMRPQTRLVLKPEPTNPHDPNAIEVYSTAGVKLGYIPRVDNKGILERLNDKDVHVRCVKTSDTFNSIQLIYEMGDPLA
jgi:hypothetical protein